LPALAKESTEAMVARLNRKGRDYTAANAIQDRSKTLVGLSDQERVIALVFAEQTQRERIAALTDLLEHANATLDLQHEALKSCR
jgi:hypothetical protein